MKIRFFVITAVLATAIFGFGMPRAIEAVTEDGLKTQIAELQAQIQELTQQLTIMQTQQSVVADWCHNFDTNFGYANSGSKEVSYLHTALEKESISFAPDTGNKFSREGGTNSAVIAFQQKYEISPLSGFVGPLTRAKLNVLYGCRPTSIKVLSPNGGEKWEPGKPYDIKWSAQNVAENVVVSIYNNAADVAGSRVTIVAESVSASAGTASFTVPLDFVLGGSYDVRVGVGANTAPQDRSDRYFSVAIVDPVLKNCRLDHLNGLGVTETSVSNKEACSTFCDHYGLANLNDVMPPEERFFSKCIFNGRAIKHYTIPNGWCYTFAENLAVGFQKPNQIKKLQQVLANEEFYDGLINGIFNNNVYKAVKDFQKKYNINPTGNVWPVTRAKLNALYRCAAPLITVTSPNGGETWKVGETHSITWNSINVNGTILTIQLKNSVTNVATMITYQTVPSSEFYSWIIPSNIAPGQYKMQLSAYSDSTNTELIQDLSDNYFTIVAADTIQPSITVTSPNGGETLAVGQIYNLTWTSTAIDNSLVNLYVISSDGTTQSNIATGIANTGNYSWTIPQNQLEGAHRFYVSSGTISDHSNNVFSIWKTTQPAAILTFLTATNTYSYNNTIPADSYATGVITFKIKANGATLSHITANDVAVQFCSVGGNCTLTGVSRSVTITPDQANISDGTESTVTVSATSKGGSGYVYFKISEIDWTANGTTTHQTSGLDNFKTPVVNAVGGVTTPSITITSPNGGETWKVGETKRITWASTGVGLIKIYLYNDSLIGSGSTHLITSTNVFASQGYYDWTVVNPYSQTSNVDQSKYKIRVDDVDADNVTIRDYSNNYFTIAAPVSDTYTLTTLAANGTVAKSPNQTTYDTGTEVTLTATANAGYHFVNWTGGASGTVNPLTITMNANKSVTANFVADVVATCTDTDGGKDYFVRGTVTNATGSSTDLCYQAVKKIAEYFCDSNGFRVYEWHACPNGCSNGACIGTTSLAPDSINSRQSLLDSMAASLLTLNYEMQL
ncbi:MAG: hypothetical protein A2528_01130 [Candidatus Staskawiczbacteria bacterium RIFOXYD2_FULL_37_9]|uniref:Peptidoglycan binding-like domain-containing protein n=1 Tax=Candidatus Staskawiczbacteria bacterium RIFOXYB1_FULL_37_44 TaxID=1802223 RepID=A0A1G2IWM4_9BACT|nr:MAG: hypothetical protein A2358_04660 [Candidatus Staskawiczbacteria bacterium RIFOXYB1_FULL_37_44]OGZ83997.1 MAG: hypothetical protein A2416_04495 [Candidatus Staskawiczbacteria bacterium RIFOXYC1_FULL_37_52]OGZ89567.1 MAG: hypothetical protein A2581_03875 [Candidatus Staskawiczbacteria bacterium RIFOXYD1_FULL_37_110]OGZ92915.1 MAG: hypothetical protein A2528_01130 [Candidatus Staskawiczbacteria bacterium RIFOXYD2_FULL_37_9]